MNKRWIAVFVLAAMALGTQAAMLDQGTKQLSLDGLLRRDEVGLRGGMGYFIQKDAEVGFAAYGAYRDFGSSSELTSLGGGVFGRYYLELEAPVIPFVQLTLGAAYAEVKIEGEKDDDNALFAEGGAGVAFFLVNNVSIDAMLYGAFSNEKIYSDKDELEDTDYGLKLGVSFFF